MAIEHGKGIAKLGLCPLTPLQFTNAYIYVKQKVSFDPNKPKNIFLILITMYN